MDPGVIALLLLALGFAWSMDAHYTGACMGMPYASGSIALRPALALMAVMTLFGAVFLSHGVLATVGVGIIRNAMIDTRSATVIIGVAFGFLLTRMLDRLCRGPRTAGPRTGVGRRAGLADDGGQ